MRRQAFLVGLLDGRMDGIMKICSVLDRVDGALPSTTGRLHGLGPWCRSSRRTGAIFEQEAFDKADRARQDDLTVPERFVRTDEIFVESKEAEMCS